MMEQVLLLLLLLVWLLVSLNVSCLHTQEPIDYRIPRGGWKFALPRIMRDCAHRHPKIYALKP